jgi:hypothetical protein
MLINPYAEKLPTYPGTRLVSIELGVIGMEVQDPWRAERQWFVRGVYAPSTKRALGGLRIKLEDNKNFITFCNQRDFEVLTGLGVPGKQCIWAGDEYVGPEDTEWFGLCADESDLLDDLYDREMAQRSEIPGVLPAGLEIWRRVHISRGLDVLDYFILLADADVNGLGPDPRIETIEDRWSHVERTKQQWEALLE